MDAKSYRHEVLSLYGALVNDVRRYREDLVPHYAQAVEFLERVSRTRGNMVELFHVSLPKLGKRVDKFLSSGRLDLTGLDHTLGSYAKSRGVLSSLFDAMVLERNHGLDPEFLTPDAIFFLRTFLYMGKKTTLEPKDGVLDEAVSDFLSCDRGLRGPRYDWGADGYGRADDSTLSFAAYYSAASIGVSQWELPLGDRGDRLPVPGRRIWNVLDQVCRVSLRGMPSLSPSDIHGRHGPGAVADTKSGGDKYLFPHWPKKLGLLFEAAEHACSTEEWWRDDERLISEHEPAARLLAVPKTLDSTRLITSEPTAHQFLQQGLMRWIRENIPNHLRSCIDFTSQKPSRALALESSRSGAWITYDLKSASDRLSCWLVEGCFHWHPTLLQALAACRSQTVTVFTGDRFRGDTYFLRKYAGQGNATTFPIQSMIYAYLCICAVHVDMFGVTAPVTSETLRRCSKVVRVFGDDIIVPSPCGPLLARILEAVGLKINWEKSHVSGKFRESCGMDAYDGHEVTPFYMRSVLLPEDPGAEDLSSWVDVSNNAHTAGLWSVGEWMLDRVPPRLAKLIPVSPVPIGCISLTSYTSGVQASRRRYNKDLQRYEVRGLRPQLRKKRRRRDSHVGLLQYFTERPRPEDKYTSGYDASKSLVLTKAWVPEPFRGGGSPA